MPTIRWSSKSSIYEMRFDEASARYGEFGAFWAGLQFSPRELAAFLDGDAIPQFDVPSAHHAAAPSRSRLRYWIASATCVGAIASSAGEVGDRSRDARDPVERARRELALRAGQREQSHRGIVERAIAPHRVAGNLGVAA